MAAGTDSPARLGVYPPGELKARGRLLAALEDAFPVRFEAYETGTAARLEGVLVLGAEQPAGLPPELPVLSAAAEEHAGATRSVRLSSALELPLRDALLSDSFTGPLGELEESATVLAESDGAPVWIERAPGRLAVACAPAELGPEESLRERLAPGRCLSLLAVVHLIRLVLGEREPDPGELRAAFVFDDPNLHWPTYGHVHYGRLAAHAREHGYHSVIAMVPLDGWLAHPGVIRTFAEHPGELSICIHGNDHLGPELGRIADAPAGVALAARAIRRSAAFERRTGLAVDPVMVPPHEELSEFAARGLAAAGYEAVCVSRPYPWVRPLGPFAAPAGRGALSGWGSREILDGGLPVLLRAGFNAPLEDLVLRAYLGQPLILYGHHDLLAEGHEPLARAAAAINALGEVRWGTLASIARAGLRTRRLGGVLEVQMLARRVVVQVPEGVGELRVDHRALGPAAPGRPLSVTGSSSPPRPSATEGVSLLEPAAPGTLELRLGAPHAEPSDLSSGPLFGALLRRSASEARDRLSVLGRGRGARRSLSSLRGR